MKSKELSDGVENIMTFKVRLEKPDIILVEDLRTFNTSCIILHVRVLYVFYIYIFLKLFKLEIITTWFALSIHLFQAEVKSDIKLSDSQRIISATLTNVQMYNCVFDPTKREKTMSQVSIRYFVRQ